MKRSRILIALFVLAVVAAAGVLLLLRSRPSAMPASAAPTASAAAPKQEAAVVAPSPSEPVDLGTALGLGRLADCSQSPALAALLEQMVSIDPETFESRRGGPIRVPGHERPQVPTFERTRETDGQSDTRLVTADLGLAGRWHGLAVTGLRRSFYEESDASYFQIRFAEPPERVRETLARNGIRLPPVGEWRQVDDEPGISTEIGIERIENGAALTCTTG